MGINGLLKGLQSFSKKRHITDFQNQALAVDASSWLHKSVYSISEIYVEAVERSKTRHDSLCIKTSAKYMIGRCTELLDHGAKVKQIYLVMDGKRCPLKVQTHEDREERRTNNLKEARRYKKEKKNEKAQDKYKACIKIHSTFADAVADEIQSHFARTHDTRVQIIRSPYEADAQLVKLCVDGVAQAIVTEDSDVLVYCATCQVSAPILYKLECRGANAGACDVISMDWLLNCKLMYDHQSNESKKKDSSLDSILKSLCRRELTNPGKGVRLFVQACVLAGSDYSPSLLNGVGLVTAFKIVRDQSHQLCNERFHNILQGLTTKQAREVDIVTYEENLARSEAVFYFHPVACLNDESIVYLNSPDISNSQILSFSHFSPDLYRFGCDLWFLGRLDGREPGDLRSPPVMDVMAKELAVPLTTIVVRKQVSKKRTHDLCNAIDLEGNNSEETANISIVKVMNPYAEYRKVLAPIDKNRRLENNETNPFATFLHTERVLIPKEGENSSMFYDNGGDVRFAKRKFSKDSQPGTRFINYSKAKAALSRPSQVNARTKPVNAALLFPKPHRLSSRNFLPEDAFKQGDTELNLVLQERSELCASDYYNIGGQDTREPFCGSSGKMPHKTEQSRDYVDDFVSTEQLLISEHLSFSFEPESVQASSLAFDAYPHTNPAQSSNEETQGICTDDDDLRHRRKDFGISRRVTLDPPTHIEVDKFDGAGNTEPYIDDGEFDLPRSAITYFPGSPGESSVLSEIEDVKAVGVLEHPIRSPVANTPSYFSDGFAEVEMRAVQKSTPFQINRTFVKKFSNREKSSLKITSRQGVSKSWPKKPNPLEAGFELQIAKYATRLVPDTPLLNFGGRRGLDIRRVSQTGRNLKMNVECISSFFSKGKSQDIWEEGSF